MLVVGSERDGGKSNKGISNRVYKRITNNVSSPKKIRRWSHPHRQHIFTDTGKKRTILGLIVVLIVTACLLYAIYSGSITSFLGSSEKYNPVEITLLTTASNVSGLGKYTEEYEFEQGDGIYIYQEYANISHDGSCDFSLDISIEHIDTGIKKYAESDLHIHERDEGGCYWFFETNESWSTGMYLVTANLVDHISSNNKKAHAIFFLDAPSEY